MPKELVSTQEAQIMMTLSALCYLPAPNIAKALTNPALATKGQWDLVWGPGVLGSNLVYITKNSTVSSGSPDQYTVAIRGTIESLLSVLEDADIFLQKPLPWLNNEIIQLADGMVDGWENISQMTSPAKGPAAGKTIADFIGSVPSGSSIFVTGHSQGGALASVVATWLFDTEPGLTIIPYTFAGQTAGNPTFANYFNHRFLGKKGGRYFHHFDIVPKAFVVSDLESINTLYSPEPPGVETTFLIEDGIRTLIDTMRDVGVVYEQCGNAIRIQDALVPCRDVHFYNRQSRFDDEVEVQHSHFTYLALLGAPLTPGVPSSPWPPASIPYS